MIETIFISKSAFMEQTKAAIDEFMEAMDHEPTLAVLICLFSAKLTHKLFDEEESEEMTQ